MKLAHLAQLESCSVEELLEQSVTDSICPAICTNKGCDYQDEFEPDAHHYTCPECGTPTVHSILIIAGVM